MKEIIIKSYIKNLSKQDIVNFALKNNIILTNNELDYIYNNIKNNYEYILSNPIIYLNKLKNNVSITTYNKIYELYTIYFPKLYH